MRKLKIVQIESFYGPFLDGHYAAHPGLAELPFAAQTQRLLQSGYSGGHNVVPYLNPSRWETHYLIPNNDATQHRWLRDHGHQETGLSRTEVLTRQLEAIAPDVIYLSDIPVFDFSTLGRLKQRPFIVGWHATYLDPRMQWPQIDLLLSGITRLRERALELGVKAVAHHMPAAPAYINALGSAPRPADLVFSGSFYGGIHQARALQYRELSRHIAPNTLDIHTSGGFPIEPGERIAFHSPVYGTEVLDLYARSRIVLDARGEFGLGDHAQVRESSNMRIFEATRAGALLLTEHSANLAACFEIGSEIETFGSTEELIDKAKFYGAPANESARQAIAAAGHARVMKEHLIEHRALRFEQLLEQHGDLPRRRAAALPGAAPTPSAQAEGRHLIVTSLDAKSFVFGLACIDKLLRLQPDAWVHVHCGDHISHGLLRECGLTSVVPVSNDDLLAAQAAWGRDAAQQGAGRLGLALVKLLAQRHANAARISFVDASLDAEAHTLAFAADDTAVHLLDHGFGADQRHAEQTLGRLAYHLLSVPAGAAGKRWLEIASDTANGADAAAERARQEGIAVRPIVATAPWNCDAHRDSAARLHDDAAPNGPFLFFLLRLNEMSTWQFLTLGDAAQWSACYQRHYVPYLTRVGTLLQRHPQLARLVNQETPLGEAALSHYMVNRDRLAKSGYRLMTAGQYAEHRLDAMGWDSIDVARIQHGAFQQLIAAWRTGRQREDLRALASVMRRLVKPGMSVLEEGCGSGYNHEFLKEALPVPVKFTGIDLAPAMVAMARDVYPDARFDVMGSESLAYADASFDVVLNGASLMHTVDYERALQEARRVARHYVVLHTVTVHDGERNIYFEKNAYGGTVVEVCFSARVLNELLAQNRLLPVLMEDSIGYNLAPVVGVPTRSVTIACYCVPNAGLPDGSIEAAPEAPRRNHYCTYFDANYLPRGILMMESVVKHDPGAHFFVLCLDDLSESVVRQAAPHATPIHVKALMEADPEFEACRSNRTQIEWYFTATSVFLNYLLPRHPEAARITYLDADLYFYCSPEYMHFEAEGASAQIVEHRFPPGQEGLVVYGRFNVGWIGFFNTDEGRQVVADYRADCIEWCYDRVEENRFGDQKYLDRWPARYPNCCVSQNNGANVGPWNLARWKRLGKLADDYFIDADRLVFFHYSGLKRLGVGDYATKEVPAAYGMYYDTLYAPYLAALGAVERRLLPLTENAPLKDIRYNAW